MSEWQKIETAPKDGTVILTAVAGFTPFANQWIERDGRAQFFVPEEWYDTEDDFLAAFHGITRKPDFWQPLPEPPKP